MDSLELLKQLKQIKPEKLYAECSRSQILATERPVRLSVWRIFAESLEAGSAMVLVGAFLVLILGGFSGFKALNIFNLNPTGLRAEADAIDMQIQLTDLSYDDFSSAIASRKESTTPMAISGSAPKKVSEPEDGGKATSSEPETRVVGIDEALRALSE
ncbi:MAG: hypothetical protein Q7S36_02260 [Candidatus Liptonbacteria bacterium]|nr:hypothetical protein [Candidatus Liptonbacteria bacterium]